MAKDYFDDILQPPENSSPRSKAQQGRTSPLDDEEKNSNFSAAAVEGAAPGSLSAQSGPPARAGERTIRNVTVSPRRPSPRQGMGREGGMQDISPGIAHPVYPPGRKQIDSRRKWVWIAAAVSLLVLALVGLFAFRATKITVTPSTRQVNFEQGKQFTAYPAADAAEGSLTYSVLSNDLEDSAVVPSKGVENVSERGSGIITVYNEYASRSVRIIKNSRFATPEGLIFRVPASIIIPGKQGNSPGSISVTVFADQPGAEYNVGPVSRFTLPGLKDSGDMYSKVYARSSSPMSGGFVGERPAVAEGALESARAEVRSRLEAKAREGVQALPKDVSTVFPDLIGITYSSLPETAEAGGGLRIYEKAHIEIPVFPEPLFASAVYHAVDSNADNAPVSVGGMESLTAKLSPSDSALGSTAIDFVLTGKALLVWDVDKSALAIALAGRGQNAFQEIIKGFPAIAEARATIEPFWKNSFPSAAEKIRVVVKDIK